MMGWRRRRSPLLWRLLKVAAAGGALYWMMRSPDAQQRQGRSAAGATSRLQRNAQRALAMKARGPKAERPESRTGSEGMHSIPNPDAPKGGLTGAAFQPALQRSRGAR